MLYLASNAHIERETPFQPNLPGPAEPMLEFLNFNSLNFKCYTRMKANVLEMTVASYSACLCL
jgi:hypothetical protein